MMDPDGRWSSKGYCWLEMTLNLAGNFDDESSRNGDQDEVEQQSSLRASTLLCRGHSLSLIASETECWCSAENESQIFKGSSLGSAKSLEAAA
jgi:hypothetical protein